MLDTILPAMKKENKSATATKAAIHLSGESMAENAFSLLITECHDQHKSASFHEANELIGRFILFCGNERIQQEARPLSLQSPS